MEITLVKLKGEFNGIINIRNNVKNVFDILQIRIDSLREIYSEFIKTNKNETFVFGLDTFHFQSKLIDIEYNDMRRLFLAINNRMYCQYFKLHKIIVDYISTNVTDKMVTDLVENNKFPVYKDLEPFKEYKFEIILDIHETILNLLSILISFLNNKENELSIHKVKQNIGLNIDNFITSFNFSINIIREKIMMFITYIEFFHKMHSKYLKRFSNKIQLMYTHISNDIKFDDSVEISKDKKKELIDDFSTDNMDKNLLKELKTSIGSETNSDVSDSKSNPTTPSDKILNTPDSVISRNFIVSQNNEINPQPNFKNIDEVNVDKEKKDYKNIFKKNINKVTNMLKIYKSTTKDNTDINCEDNNITKLTYKDKDIADFFNGIEESCDSIINKPSEKRFLLPENKQTIQDSDEHSILSFENEDESKQPLQIDTAEENVDTTNPDIVEENVDTKNPDIVEEKSEQIDTAEENVDTTNPDIVEENVDTKNPDIVEEKSEQNETVEENVDPKNPDIVEENVDTKNPDIVEEHFEEI